MTFWDIDSMPLEVFGPGIKSKAEIGDESYFIPAGKRHGWKTFDRSVKLLDISLKQP